MPIVTAAAASYFDPIIQSDSDFDSDFDPIYPFELASNSDSDSIDPFNFEFGFEFGFDSGGSVRIRNRFRCFRRDWHRRRSTTTAEQRETVAIARRGRRRHDDGDHCWGSLFNFCLRREISREFRARDLNRTKYSE